MPTDAALHDGMDPADDDGDEPAEEEGSIFTAHVPPETAGERIDKALAMLLPGLSRARIQALLGEGRVVADGVLIGEASRRVKAGQTLTVTVPPPEPAVPRPQALPLAIVHEDEHVIVVDKPAGLVVHPAPGNPDGTLVNALLFHCGERLSGIGGVRRPGIVHRLDKDTSGLLVAAKTDAAHRALAAQFSDRTLCRTYLAIVRGVPSPAVGDLAGAIGRDSRDRKRMAVVARGGKSALTHYRTLERFPNVPAALLECRLATGRTHQIRVHLAHLGHWVVGDAVYLPSRRGAGLGADVVGGFSRQALHAAELRFVHPATGDGVRFASPLPADMQGLLSRLRAY